MQFPGEIQGQSTERPEKVRTVDWIPLFVYPDLVFVVVCGRDKCCLSVRFTCMLWLMCVYCVMFDLRRKSPKSPKRPNQDSSVTSQKIKTLDKIMNDINQNVNLQKKRTLPESLCLLLHRPTFRSIQ